MMDYHDYKNDNLNSFIEKGQRVTTIALQLDSISKSSESNEIRALAAAVLALISEIKASILFKA